MVFSHVCPVRSTADLFVRALDPPAAGRAGQVRPSEVCRRLDRRVYAPNKDWADEVISEVADFRYGEHDDWTDTVS